MRAAPARSLHTARLHSLLLTTHDVQSTLAFYRCLGFTPSAPAVSPAWVALSSDVGTGAGASSGVPLFVQGWPSASPPPPPLLLNFSVPSDALDALLPRLIAAGGTLAGAVQRDAAGVLATLRAPAAAGGHFFTLREREALA